MNPFPTQSPVSRENNPRKALRKQHGAWLSHVLVACAGVTLAVVGATSAQAAPTLGTTSFNSPASGGFASVSLQPSPASVNYLGYTLQSASNNQGSITHASSRVNLICGVGSSVSYVAYGSDDGSEFRALSLNFRVTTAGYTGTLTATGYKDGSAAPGATTTFSAAATATDYAWDFSGLSSFQNVDQVRISGMTGTGSFSINSIGIAAAVLPVTGTMMFTNNTGVGDGIVQDGEAGSSDIAGITMQVINITDTAGTNLGVITWKDNSWLGSGDSAYSGLTYDQNAGTKGMAIKSSDGAEFQLNQFLYYNWGESSSTTITVKGYRNAVEVASTTFAGWINTLYMPITVNLDSTFDNVDDVRLYISAGGYQGDQSASNHSINNIVIAPPVAAPTAPEIVVSETGVGEVADNGSFSFGTTTVGTPVTKTFTVTNNGTAVLNVSGLSAPGGFSIAADFGSTAVAAGGGTTTFQITMNAGAAATPSGTLTFGNNDSNENPYNFTVSGTVNPAPVAVSSLVRANANPSRAATVNWTLTFASAVSGVTAGNFTLSGAAAAGAAVGTPTTANGGLSWTVPVTTGSTDGALVLNLANATGLSAPTSNLLPYYGESYTMDKTAPTVVSVVRFNPSGQSTSSTSVVFRVTYSEDVTLTAPATNRFAVMPVGGSTITGTVASVSGTGDTRDVTVNLTGGTGEFRLRVVD